MELSEDSEQTETRQPLNQQASQCIVVDLCSPITKENLDLIAECLHNVLPIISVLPGPPRVPLLGIVVSSNLNGIAEEVILGFEKVRGNFTRCFEAVRSLHTEFSCSAHPNQSQSILAALVKSLKIYHNVIIKKPGMDFELELTIISPSLGFKVSRQVVKAVAMTGIQCLKLVTIFCLQSGQYNIDELEVSDEEPTAEEDLASLVNIQYNLLTNSREEDKNVLMKHFMGWLGDRNKDSHHLELSVPHPYNDSEDTHLRFDMKELLLPTSALPFHNRTNVELTAAFIKPPHLATKADGVFKFAVPIYRLNIILQTAYSNQLIPYLHGTPMVLEATQCWKIDWDELDANKSKISALHSVLHNKKNVLICQLGSTGEEDLSPLPYYCILPTARCLLIHHIAYREMLISAKSLNIKQEEKENFRHQLDMELSLGKLITDENFDPLKLGNVEYIKSLTRSLLPRRLSNRKRPVTSSSASKRSKTKYPPLDGCSPNCQPMEICPTQPKKSGRRVNSLINPVSNCSMVMHSQPKAAAALFPKLLTPRRSFTQRLAESPRQNYIQPSIASQLEPPTISADQNVAYCQPFTSNTWISRDDSKPLCSSSVNNSKQSIDETKLFSSKAKNYIRSAPARYTTKVSPVARDLETYVEKSGSDWLVKEAQEFCPLVSSDDEESYFLSPMEYDGLSQTCQVMQVSQGPSPFQGQSVGYPEDDDVQVLEPLIANS